jgi:hypothetical protein
MTFQLIETVLIYFYRKYKMPKTVDYSSTRYTGKFIPSVYTHQEHVKKEAIRRYPCSQCDYKATRKCYLITHIETIHLKIYHLCNKCDYKSLYKRNLTQHIKSKHDFPERYPKAGESPTTLPTAAVP